MNEYLNAINNNEEIILPENNVGKSVICLSTGKIFDKVIEGANNYNCNPTGISLCCKNKLNYSGKLTNGTKLIWMYYEDFLKLPIEEQNEILEINQELSNDDSFIM